jgi:hypothetical protein
MNITPIMPNSITKLPITPKLQQIETNKKAAKFRKKSQKKAPFVAEHVQGLKKDIGTDLQSINVLNNLLANIRDNNELQEFEKKLNILSRGIEQQKDATIKRAFNDLQRNYRFVKRSMYIENYTVPTPSNDYTYLTDYAGNMIRQIQESQVSVVPYRGSGELESEINGYKIITQNDGLRPNIYNHNTIIKIKTAITFFRGKMLGWAEGSAANIYQKRIIYLILSYQSDPDWDDMLRLNFQQRVASAMTNSYHGYRMFLINLDSNGNISADLFTKKLKDTRLGDQILEFMSDPDDMFIVGYNRLYNILFELMVNLFLMAFVFQYWPNFTYIDQDCYWDEYNKVPEENAFAVYIGTGPLNSDNANVVNFHLDEIINGRYDTRQPIRLFAPVTSASNDADVALGFANGVIIKIYCINVKPYMCVSKTAGEAETFILAGDYMFLKQYPLLNNSTTIVFEFLQIESDFNGIRPNNISQIQFNEKKKELEKEIKDAFPSFNPLDANQESQDERTMDDTFPIGGRLTKRKRNRKRQTKTRNRRRRTNKRYNKKI